MPHMHHADAVVRDKRFWRAPYVGHKGGVSMDAEAGSDWGVVGEMIKESYTLIAPKKSLAKLDGGAAAGAGAASARPASKRASTKSSAKKTARKATKKAARKARA